jgi:hypothetical protein
MFDLTSSYVFSSFSDVVVVDVVDVDVAVDVEKQRIVLLE